MNSIEDIIGHHVALKKRGKEWSGLCPFHGESTPSFSVYYGQDGKGRFKCFGCGAHGDQYDFISQLLGVDFITARKQIDGDDVTGTRVEIKRRPVEAPEWQPICPAPADVPALDQVFNPNTGRVWGLNPQRVDAYRNPAGQLMGYVIRYETGEGKKITPQVTWCENRKTGSARWCSVGMPEPRYPLGCEQLAKRPDAPVLIVEGEKARHAAARMMPRHVVLSWAGGTNAVSKTDWSCVGERRVVLWPDADAQGESAMRDIAAKLADAELHWIDPTGLLKGHDAHDIGEQVGWDTERLRAWAKPRLSAYVPPIPPKVEISKPEPEPTPEPEPPPAAEPPPAEAQSGELTTASMMQTWERLGLTLNGQGMPDPNLDNACRILNGHPETRGRIWYDNFLQRIMTSWPNGETVEWSDGHDGLLTLWMQRSLGIKKATTMVAAQAVTVTAMANARNEVTDWLTSLSWDYVPRIEALMHKGFGVERNPYTEAVGRCWMISMVARALDPGCKVDTMPVFEGGQGMRKSTAMEALVGKRWFAEAAESPTSKDFYQALHGKLLVEIAELDSFSRAEVNTIKRVITCKVDRYRAPYGRRAEDHPRMCVFSGTTNRDDWNRDETGARRFWPITCVDLDIDWIEANRAQLFAEAVAQYRAGRPWWDVPSEDAKREQEARRANDEWEEPIRGWLVGKPECSVAEVMEFGLKIEMSKWDKPTQMRVATCLRAIGWERVTAWRAGRPVKVWRQKE